MSRTRSPPLIRDAVAVSAVEAGEQRGQRAGRPGRLGDEVHLAASAGPGLVRPRGSRSPAACSAARSCSRRASSAQRSEARGRCRAHADPVPRAGSGERSRPRLPSTQARLHAPRRRAARPRRGTRTSIHVHNVREPALQRAARSATRSPPRAARCSARTRARAARSRSPARIDPLARAREQHLLDHVAHVVVGR